MSWAQQVALAKDQVDWSIKLAQQYVLPWWGKTLLEFPTPLWPGLHAAYMSHECAIKQMLGGKKVFAPGRFILTRYPEVGPDNLTARKGDNEVVRFGKHPYDIRSHFWAGQQAFWESKALVEPWLAKYGFAPFDQLAALDQFSLLLLPRAIGIGCTRGLLRKASRMAQYNKFHPVLAMQAWLSQPGADTTPFDGSQTTETIQLRFSWCTTMVLRAHEVGAGTMPLWAEPPVDDPGDLVPLPKDFMANMKAYSRQARRQGPMPTGPYVAP